MPGFDGTGPSGKGPLTGRGRGICGKIPGGKAGGILTAIAVPVLGAVVNDIRNPDGVSRRLFTSLRRRLSEGKRSDRALKSGSIKRDVTELDHE